MSEAPAIARLFVALPLSSPISQTLTRIQPPKQIGVRPVNETDLHITLHILGSSEIDSASEALRNVSAAPFSIAFKRPGHFSLRGRRTILWVGVEPVDELIALHAKTADALRGVGFEPETRPYLPHVTLARLAANAPRSLVESFEQASLPDGKIEIECSQFALYASETAPEGARYRVLDSYPLAAAG